MRDIKIQCTIGPSCNDPQILADMLEAGMDVARVNLSHGSAADQADKLVNFRKAVRMSGKEYASIMFDIRGPEIRVKRASRKTGRKQPRSTIPTATSSAAIRPTLSASITRVSVTRSRRAPRFSSTTAKSV